MLALGVQAGAGPVVHKAQQLLAVLAFLLVLLVLLQLLLLLTYLPRPFTLALTIAFAARRFLLVQVLDHVFRVHHRDVDE